MSHLRSIPFDGAHPMIVLPFSGETIEDIGCHLKEVMKEPFDMLEFQAAPFNGITNFAHLWDVLERIAAESDEAPILFSCNIHDLPEYYQTNRDYEDILTFAVRTTQIDVVAIESFLPPDSIADIADKCVESDVIPMITIRVAPQADASAINAQLMELVDLGVSVFQLVMPVDTEEEISRLEQAAVDFMKEHDTLKVIPQPVGPLAKAQLLQGNTFHASLLFAAPAETATLPASGAIKAFLK